MTPTVMMLIICWTVQHGEIREAWRIERPATAETCATMSEVGNQGGKAGVITVRCDELPPQRGGC